MSDPGGWSAPSRWSDIIFDVKIENLFIENLHLDIHERLLECNLYTCKFVLIIPRIICTCKTVNESFRKSIIVFSFFLGCIKK